MDFIILLLIILGMFLFIRSLAVSDTKDLMITPSECGPHQWELVKFTMPDGSTYERLRCSKCKKLPGQDE